MAAFSDSVARMCETAAPRWIVFPRYLRGAEPLLTPRPKTTTFVELAKNAFNYHTLGETAFEMIAGVLDECDCYDFVYSRLDDALEVFDWMAETAARPDSGARGASR